MGQTSAWLVWSFLGLYPVDPCGASLHLGKPRLPRARVAVPHGRFLDVVADALRNVAQVLLDDCDVNTIDVQKLQALDQKHKTDLKSALAYLRDRVGVPRDMSYPAARCLRATLNAFNDHL